jgi:hypothetical protein
MKLLLSTSMTLFTQKYRFHLSDAPGREHSQGCSSLGQQTERGTEEDMGMFYGDERNEEGPM